MLVTCFVPVWLVLEMVKINCTIFWSAVGFCQKEENGVKRKSLSFHLLCQTNTMCFLFS